MSRINGRLAEEWIEKNKPKNGLFRVYWDVLLPEHSRDFEKGKDWNVGGATFNPKPGAHLRYEWYYKDGERADGVSKGWWNNGKLKSEWTLKNGKLDGESLNYHHNGIPWQSETFKDDILNGPYLDWWYSGRQKTKGEYRNAKKHGKWTHYYKDEKKHLEEFWNKGIFCGFDNNDEYYTGKRNLYDHDGLFMKGEVHYKNGKRNGKYIGYYESTNKKNYEGTYTNGLPSGKWIAWHENGNRRYEMHFTVTDRKSAKNGLETWWYESGKKRIEVHYKDGVKHGTWTSWYENGRLQNGTWGNFINKFAISEELEGTYKYGKRVGEWIGRSEGNYLEYKIIYVDGEMDKYIEIEQDKLP
jgi:antitoxin component YwqK of YwqJK toxin-antitoxin module